ncbi:MAG: glycosyltransferase family 2 protein [Candidatus Limivivens sp.]|nr:glycosyltransferase family 2 protein [Candidatus Limivivens sp.]
MDKILTVVVPTYNVEKYIEQCLNSFVVPDILVDLEVLIVNDGSRDRSVELAQKFADTYPGTFRMIHKENGGHGSTINRGIREASGRYFKVVDGDDWVDGEAFRKLIRFLKETDSDAVVTKYYWFHHQTGKMELEFKEPFPGVSYGKEYSFSEISQRFFMKMHALTLKTELLRGKIPPIDEQCYYVDMEYVLFPVPFIRTITFLDEVVYLYRIGLPGQSMNMKRMQKNAENYDRVLNRLLAYYRELSENQAPAYVLTYLENALGAMAASRFKIYLSFPYGKKTKTEMIQFDKMLLRDYPKVYQAVNHKAVLALRRSSYFLYLPAHAAFCMQERLKK